MNKLHKYKIATIGTAFCLQMSVASAGLDSAVAQGIATAIGGKTVSDIVSEIRQSGVDLIDQATHTGNAMIARSGNEANVLADNLDILLKEDINLTFNQLSEERKAVLIEAEALRRSLSLATDTAYNFKDSTILDLNALTSSLPFGKQKFFVQSIRGLSYLPQSGDFKIQIAASTLGIQEDVKTEIEVFKGIGADAIAIPEIKVDQSKAHFFADVTIPNKNLRDEYSESEMKVTPLTIRFKVIKNKGWWIFSTVEQASYDIPVYLSLFPAKSGELIARTKSPVYAWKAAGTKIQLYTTPNRTSKEKGTPTKGGNRIEFAVSGGPEPYKPGFQKLINPYQRHVSGNGGWSDGFNLALTDNDTRLIFTWNTWSTPGTWEAGADVLEYRLTGEASGISPTTEMRFGRLLEILVPKDMTYGALAVTTFTKQQYEIQIGQPDPYGLLTYQGTSSAGPDMARVSYRVNDPSSVATTKF